MLLLLRTHAVQLLSEYIGCLKLVTFMVCQFPVSNKCQSALLKNMDNIVPHAIVLWHNLKADCFLRHSVTKFAAFSQVQNFQLF